MAIQLIADINELVHEIYSKADTIATRYHLATIDFRLLKQTLILVRNTDARLQRLQGMASEQEVPLSEEDKYAEVTAELTNIHEQMVTIHAQLDNLIIKTKEAETKLNEINKVEKIVRKYNNLS